jgi:hypothetical protein
MWFMVSRDFILCLYSGMWILIFCVGILESYSNCELQLIIPVGNHSLRGRLTTLALQLVIGS